MRVLVTGNRGGIGAVVSRHLESLGHEVTGFDIADGLVCFSSAQVFGTAEGERPPDYFPIDDAHPRRAMRPYGLSKVLSEDLCAGFTARTGIPTVALRPVWVWQAGQYERIEASWRADPASEYEPFWEFGAFVDVRDVATAVELALTVPLAGHHRLLLCAPDIAASMPSLRAAASWAPHVPVKNPAPYQQDPWHALVDCAAAEAALRWRPAYRWSGRPRRAPEAGGPE
jgi:UDP-glucose 4-epimerase